MRRLLLASLVLLRPVRRARRRPAPDPVHLRAIASASLRDDVTVEGSAGWFAGEGRDLVSRFGDSDFACLRLKYSF